jgi:2'-5' RNA ligase
MQGKFEFYEDLLARPARPERLFFGLFPDAATSIRVKRLADRFIGENRLKGTPLKAERLHVSLHHVGDYRRLRTKFTYAARQAGEAVSMRPFEVTFPFIKSFERAAMTTDIPHRRPLVLLGEGGALLQLHKILGAALERNGLKAAKNFMPHMTLHYGSRPVPLQAIEPIRFSVIDFALVHSELWLTRYNIVDRWPLALEG